MKVFNKYHTKRTPKWWFEWGIFTGYEKQVVSIEFHFPTPKDKSLFFGITLFTITIIFFEIAYLGEKKPIEPLNLFPDGKV